MSVHGHHFEHKQPKQPFSWTLKELWEVFFKGFLSNNVVLVQAVGICPIIAIGTNLKFGVALTVCTAVMLLPVSLFMSLLGDKLPLWLRAPLYTIVASLILLGAAVVIDRSISHELYASLYVFLPLMSVNTLVTYQAGGFSVSHEPAVALTDAFATSLGFGLVICAVSALREIVSFGTLWDTPVAHSFVLPDAALPYAAFLLLGFMAAFLQWIKSKLNAQPKKTEVG